ASRAAVEEVVVVFKTHFDIGYTDLARNVVAKYRTSMIDNALAVCDEAKAMPPEHRFVWTLSGWPMEQVLWPGQTPERRGRIVEAIRDGRLAWHALPASLHTESLDLEDLVRGMEFSSRLSRQFGLPLPRDAKMTDVPAHTWVLATILKHAGVEFMHIGCNGGSSMVEVPQLFWWEGPDGSRVLTMYSGDYGTGLKPPADWPHKTWLALIHTGDNHGPPTADEVRGLLQLAAREVPGVKIRLGRLSDFSDAILKENPTLPVVRADLADTWIKGIMSMPVETKLARNVRPEIAALDALGTLLPAWGVRLPANRDPPGTPVAAAYEGSLLFGEHTWGFDAKNCPRLYGKAWEQARAAGKYARLEESWGEKAAYIRKAADLTRAATTADLQALARSVRVAGPRIVVFNPLPWPRDGIATVRLLPGTSYGLKDAATGQTVPCQQEVGTLSFLARDVPALGYRTYVPTTSTPLVPREEDASRRSVTSTGEDASRRSVTSTLENSLFRLRLDPVRGVVASLVDKRSGREWVDSASKYGLGQYVYERFDADEAAAYVKAYCRNLAPWVFQDFAKSSLPPAKDVPHVTASPKNFRLSISRGPLRTIATMRAAAGRDVPHDVTLRVTLAADQPYIDVEWQVTDKKADPWPEGGWLCFPMKIDQPRFRLGRLGSVTDPAKDIVRSGNFDTFCLNTGLNVVGGDSSGVGLCPIDSPLVSLGYPGLYRSSRTFEPRQPLVLVNLFANVYGTNFQQWIGGTWSSRVRLWAVDGKKLEADLITPAWEARSPLQTAILDGPAGGLPPAQAGIELSRKGVLVTALGPNPDGGGTLLRLWEQAGEGGVCTVRLPEPLRNAAAQPCDLRGRPQGAPISPRDGRHEVPLAPFAPASILLGAERK
ncbi:MAG: hypothetical protein ABSG68_20515, partial [Thermoguttaceae bacterium]